MRERVRDMEYVFCDTGEELRETYDYLQRLEAFLGRQIVRLNPDRPFSHYLELYNGVLPDARTRWCTRMLKIRPFERFVGDDQVLSYIAMRADESERKGYISTKPNITPTYPFIDEGVTRSDVLTLLGESGLGLPAYYAWRSRSGCCFCFFQQKIEWIGLLENHPDLYERAMAMEWPDRATGRKFTWSDHESLAELKMPERMAQVKLEARQRTPAQSGRLLDVLAALEDDQDGERACLICRL
jgi:hypothetical protein